MQVRGVEDTVEKFSILVVLAQGSTIAVQLASKVHARRKDNGLKFSPNERQYAPLRNTGELTT